ncbi:hypothetical protein, partial [Escherichia coli]|uniref:hypothetical protein n=1 Tax=Escherichia coli TaxID=562 RepID=UPI0013213986
MRWSRRRFLAATTTALALSACSSGGAPAGGAGAGEDEDVPTYHYGDHPAQFAELTLPSGSSAVGVVVIVHGGFWRDAYGADLGRPLARDLVLRGYAALN